MVTELFYIRSGRAYCLLYERGTVFFLRARALPVWTPVDEKEGSRKMLLHGNIRVTIDFGRQMHGGLSSDPFKALVSE